MIKTCSVSGCKSNIEKQSKKISVISNQATMFGFPNEKKYPDIFKKWVQFCVQHDLVVTKNSGICCTHFDAKWIKIGKRKTLRWTLSPVPTNYGNNDIPITIRPTPTSTRKPPKDRSKFWWHQRFHLLPWVQTRVAWRRSKSDFLQNGKQYVERYSSGDRNNRSQWKHEREVILK